MKKFILILYILTATSCMSLQQKRWFWDQVGRASDEEVYLEELERLENADEEN